MRSPLFLWFEDANEADNPFPVSDQVAVPTARKLGGVQVGFVRDREEQAVIATPLLYKRGDVQTKMKGRFCFCSCRSTEPLQQVAFLLPPNRVFCIRIGEPSWCLGDRFEPVSFWVGGWLELLLFSQGRPAGAGAPRPHPATCPAIS